MVGNSYLGSKWLCVFNRRIGAALESVLAELNEHDKIPIALQLLLGVDWHQQSEVTTSPGAARATLATCLATRTGDGLDRRHYSARSAVIGSTLHARRAGR